ncbi:MAG: hypothetical protein JNM18_16795 [Planctomycetaceae bacterium]|nr:hypothetical protein [Planctomycetaceae bacterium]
MLEPSPVLTEAELCQLLVVAQTIDKHLRLHSEPGERATSIVAIRAMVAQIHGRGLAVDRCQSILAGAERFYSRHKWRWDGAENIHRAMRADVAGIVGHLRERLEWVQAGGPPL